MNLIKLAASIFSHLPIGAIKAQAAQAIDSAVDDLVAKNPAEKLQPAFTLYIEGRLGIAAGIQNSLWTHLFGHKAAADYSTRARAALEPEIALLFPVGEAVAAASLKAFAEKKLGVS